MAHVTLSGVGSWRADLPVIQLADPAKYEAEYATSELIDGPFLMRHKHLPCALVELLQIAQTPSGADGVLHHPPEAFDGVEVMAAVGRQAREASRAVIVVEGGVELVRPMDPAAINDQHDLFPRFLEGRHPLVQIWAQL